jgi:uncharacterized protein YdhG (YjbR/CyaY superfamily)
MSERAKPKNIDEYIATFSPKVRNILEKIRATIHQAAPHAVEAISYQIPAFVFGKSDRVFFAAFKKHIGMYPPPKGDAKLQMDLARYRGDRGNLKFPLDEPMPYELIRRIVKFKLKENRGVAAGKRPAKKRSKP